MPTRGSSARERLASALKEARLAAGLSGVQAGEAAGFGQSKVSKIERQALLPSIDDVRSLSQAYGLPSRRRDELTHLASELRDEQSARVILARRVGEMQSRIHRLESSAEMIRGFQPVMIPGLLQTPEYAACVFGQPDSLALGQDELDGAVHARIARQGVLADKAKHIRLVMTEGALRWQAGSAGLMATQIDALAELASLRNLDLRVIPWSQPVDVFPRHGFHIYDEDAVIVGTETATAFLTGRSDIATYRELFGSLESLALKGRAARDYLEQVADRYRDLI